MSSKEHFSRTKDIIETDHTNLLNRKYSPSDIKVGKYIIPDSLGHVEYEELAARIITIAQEEGVFVAVSYQQIVQDISKNTSSLEDRWLEPQTMEALFEKIVFPIRDAFYRFMKGEEYSNSGLVNETVTSVISVTSVNLAQEIKNMIEKGFLHLSQVNGKDYLAPTAELIDKLLHAQDIRENKAS